MQNKITLKSIVLSIFLLATQYGFSQSKISGKVIDSNKLAIVGANISINNKATKKLGTTSNSDGEFTIQVKNKGGHFSRWDVICCSKRRSSNADI